MKTHSTEIFSAVQNFYWDFLDQANKRKGLKDLHSVRDEKTLAGIKCWLHDHRNDFMTNKETSINVVVALSDGGFSISYDSL